MFPHYIDCRVDSSNANLFWWVRGEELQGLEMEKWNESKDGCAGPKWNESQAEYVDLTCNKSKRKAHRLIISARSYTFGHVKQLNLLKPESKSYGGELRKRRNGRGARPISTKESMHLVLRSSKAKGDWSFRKKVNAKKIEVILRKFSKRYSIRILSVANVGNHIHLHIQLIKRATYKPFIRAVTAAIAMAITGASRWNKIKARFWDYRPFTRVVRGLRAVLSLKDYVSINQLEGIGHSRIEARFILASRRNSS